MMKLKSVLLLSIMLSTAGAAKDGSTVADTQIVLRQHMLDSDISSMTFRNMDNMFETRIVKRGKSVWQLPYVKGYTPPTYESGGVTLAYEDFAQRTYTNAFLIIRDGKILFEDYRNRAKSGDRFIGFSATKSIVSILIGIAVRQKHIHSIDDPASNYVPELKGAGYDGVSIRHVLQMRSGIDYEERYDFGTKPSFAAMIHINAIVANKERFADSAIKVKRGSEPGSRFNYATLDTAVLGWVLERATRQPLAQYMTKNLWQPAGMEADGYFIADGPEGVGRELSGMGYNATLRDFGRFGQLLLQNGKRGDKQVIPADWVKQATTMLPFKREGLIDFGEGYGFQFWQVDNEPGAFAAVGLAGQFIYVHPSTRTVIVKLSHYPVPEPAQVSTEALAYFKAVVSH